jgi:hypothetical protein
VIAAIEASSPAAGSSAAELLENLRSPDPVKLLAERVAEYHNQLERKVRDGATRQSELQRLFNRAIALRHAVLAHPVLKELDETGGDRLFPAP